MQISLHMVRSSLIAVSQQISQFCDIHRDPSRVIQTTFAGLAIVQKRKGPAS
jgi:hypothetical protein